MALVVLVVLAMVVAILGVVAVESFTNINSFCPHTKSRGEWGQIIDYPLTSGRARLCRLGCPFHCVW